MEFTEMEKRMLYQTEGCERYAIIAGDDLRGLGTCHQQAFSRNSGNGNPAKYAILRKIALLAGSLYTTL